MHPMATRRINPNRREEGQTNTGNLENPCSRAVHLCFGEYLAPKDIGIASLH